MIAACAPGQVQSEKPSMQPGNRVFVASVKAFDWAGDAALVSSTPGDDLDELTET